MYERFYGLQERPFDLTPNPRFLLMTPRHQEALSTLEYGISSRKGVALVVGAVGTGKTTLVQAALDSQKGQASLGVCLSNPALTRAEFFEFLADGFGLSRDAAHSKTRLLIELRAILESRHQDGAATALIIDEAQSLPDELLEEVRLLANIETSTAKLLAVVLVGHPELADRLNRPHLQHLKQRVALRAVLTPLDASETSAYISTRIGIAGGDGYRLFTREAVLEIYARSRGIPRTVSVICDNALVAGFALDQRPVTRATVIEVCRDLDFPVLASTPVTVVAAPSSRAQPVRAQAQLAQTPTTRPAIVQVSGARSVAVRTPAAREETPPAAAAIPVRGLAAAGTVAQAPEPAPKATAIGQSRPKTPATASQSAATRATAPVVSTLAVTANDMRDARDVRAAVVRTQAAAPKPPTPRRLRDMFRFFHWRSRPISIFETPR